MENNQTQLSVQDDKESRPAAPLTLTGFLSMDSVKNRFNDILGKKSPAFISSIISATKANKQLAACTPNSIISSAVIAATLDLPIQSNLGFAHIVPYKNKGVDEAQFQMGWKGYVQLALRTAQYQNLNAVEIYEGELVKHNRITGEIEINQDARTGNKVIGYVAYFKLINGFEKYLYWTKEQCEAHGKKYSKSFTSQYGRWQQDFDSMALKTVVKQLLSKFGILSVEMQTAIQADQAIIRGENNDQYDYVDGHATEVPDTKWTKGLNEGEQQQ